jgi:hypothetical protein
MKSAFSGTVCARTETSILSELARANVLAASQNLTFDTVFDSLVTASFPLSRARALVPSSYLVFASGSKETNLLEEARN